MREVGRLCPNPSFLQAQPPQGARNTFSPPCKLLDSKLREPGPQFSSEVLGKQLTMPVWCGVTENKWKGLETTQDVPQALESVEVHPKVVAAPQNRCTSQTKDRVGGLQRNDGGLSSRVQLRMLLRCHYGGDKPENQMNGQWQATKMNPNHETNLSPPFACPSKHSINSRNKWGTVEEPQT